MEEIQDPELKELIPNLKERILFKMSFSLLDATDYIFFKLMSYKMSPTVKEPITENGKKILKTQHCGVAEFIHFTFKLCPKESISEKWSYYYSTF